MNRSNEILKRKLGSRIIKPIGDGPSRFIPVVKSIDKNKFVDSLKNKPPVLTNKK